jgi:hypothetical protein
MDGKKGGWIGPVGDGGGRGGATIGAWRGEPGAKAIEPVVEGMEGDAAGLAELGVGQAGPTEVGQDG